MEAVLSINGLSKKYGSIQALNRLSLDIPSGSIYGILGPNGSGKTTTLATVLNVLKATEGSYQWFGGAFSFSAKRRVGAILETPNFYPYLSAYKNLEIVAKIKEIKDPDYEGVLQLVDLKERAKSKFKSYSLGMKQRLAIASALLCKPEVLVLDEPTNGLDPQGIAEVRQMILDIAKQGITIIIASHLLVEVEKVCTHVAVIKKGNLLYAGLVEGLTRDTGFIELNASDQVKLESALKKIDEVEEINRDGYLFRVSGTTALTAELLNRKLAEHGVYLNHLEQKKTNLETQFLELINQKAS
jgi:ABC-2 type transport system ATP-binding protein